MMAWPSGSAAAEDSPDLLIRRLFRGSSRPGHVPSDVAGQRSPVRIVDLRFAALSGQNPASPHVSFVNNCGASPHLHRYPRNRPTVSGRGTRSNH
jgi:hypothetical protein